MYTANVVDRPTTQSDHDELGRVELQRGQNVFFFTVTTVTLSAEMIKLLHTTTPSLFVTYGFYDFALSITPVVEGTRCVTGWGEGHEQYMYHSGQCLTTPLNMSLKLMIPLSNI